MRRWLVALGCSSALLWGCGGDDEEGTGETTAAADSGAPTASQPLEEAVAGLNEAIAEQDCETFVTYAFSVQRPPAKGSDIAEPDQPAQPQECDEESPVPGLLADLEGYTFEESEEFGAAAVSQGSGGKPVGGYDTWGVIWLVDRDGQWHDAAFFPTDPQFDEEIGEGADPVGVTEAMIEAVASGDCSAADEIFARFSRFAESKEEGCEVLAAGSIFAPAVKEAGDAVEVEELGTTRDYSIVGIDTGETYFAAILATPPIDPNEPPQGVVEVIDVLPLTDFEVAEPKEKK